MNPCEIRLNQTSENLEKSQKTQNSSLGGGYFWLLSLNSYCHSASQALDVRKTRRIMTEPQLG